MVFRLFKYKGVFMDCLIEKAASLGIGKGGRHIFLCCDQTKPACCQYEDGLASWEYLKKRIKELGLTETLGLQRTKANCLRICQKGPIAVIYPDGIWYHSCTPEGLEKILQQHILQGIPVQDLQITLGFANK